MPESVHVLATKFVEFCVRYFVIAGGAYCLFEVVFRKQFLRRRIQRTAPPLAQIGYEIGWSMSNTACSALATLFTYRLTQAGRTSMYFGLAEHGWTYVPVSIVLCILGYDTWLYWEHRWLHTRWMFRHVHSIHHKVGNPSAFASFAHHPIETFLGNLYFVLFVVFVPIHPVALGAAGGLMFLYGIVGHLGYEFYPRGFARHPLLGLFNTATYHNIHHRDLRSNYAAYLIYWDRLMGTDHPRYYDVFDAIKDRLASDGAQPDPGVGYALP